MVITIGTPQPCQEIRVGIWGELVIARTVEDHEAIAAAARLSGESIAVIPASLYHFACQAFVALGEPGKIDFIKVVREAAFLIGQGIGLRACSILFDVLCVRARTNGLLGEYGVIGLPGLVGEGIVKIYGGK